MDKFVIKHKLDPCTDAGPSGSGKVGGKFQVKRSKPALPTASKSSQAIAASSTSGNFQVKLALPTSSHSQSESSQANATPYNRSFNHAWTKQFQWLLYSQGTNKMHCRPCRILYGPYSIKTSNLTNKFHKYAEGSLVQGTSNFKRSVLVKHETSLGHTDAIQKEKSSQGDSKSGATWCLKQLNSKDFERMSVLFRNAHAIALKCRPFRDFTWMCELDRKKGVTTGDTYINDKQCREFINYIADVERQKILQQLSQAKFLSLLSDGSTDVGVIENEAVYARICINGEVKIFFLNIIAVPRANAEGIFNAIMKSLNKFDEELKHKIIGFTCDGASVNVGQIAGVITFFHSLYAAILLVHCLSHRLELSFKQAVKGVKLYEKINSLLSELFKFYHTSPLQTENLKTSFNSLEIPVALPHRVGGTRWVSHTFGALEQVWKGYPAYVQHLSQVKRSDF